MSAHVVLIFVSTQRLVNLHAAAGYAELGILEWSKMFMMNTQHSDLLTTLLLGMCDTTKKVTSHITGMTHNYIKNYTQKITICWEGKAWANSIGVMKGGITW